VTYNVQMTDGTSSYHVDATNNWWNTTDTTAIQATIFDCQDDTSLPCVDVSPVETGAAVATPAPVTITPVPQTTSTPATTPLATGTSATNTPIASASTAVPTTTPTLVPTVKVVAGIELDPSTVTAGAPQGVSVTGVGFGSNEKVQVGYTAKLNTGATALQQTEATAFAGAFSATLPVPLTTVGGSYDVTAKGESTGATATATLIVKASPNAPVLTNTAIPTATSSPTGTPSITRTPSATSTPIATATPVSTAIPGVAIDRVEILHLVNGSLEDTRDLHLGERASFVVLYHTSGGAGLIPSSTVIVTKRGRAIHEYGMHATTVDGHAAFERTAYFTRRKLSGVLFAHFMVMFGSNTAKRDRRFHLMP
jgi:hypothetical protein